MTTDSLLIINTLASVLEAIAVAATLIFVIKQTAATNKSVKEVEREFKLAALTNEKSLTREINLLLVQDEKLAKLLGYSKSDILAFMMLHDFEQQYNLWKGGLISEQKWQASTNLISKSMAYPFVQIAWDKIKSEYQSPFGEFAEQFIPKKSGQKVKKHNRA